MSQPIHHEEAYRLFSNAIDYVNGFPYKDGFLVFKDVLEMFPEVNVYSSLDPRKTPLLKRITQQIIRIPSILMEDPLAFYRTRDENIIALLQRGANPNLTDSHGKNMLELYQRQPFPSNEVCDLMSALISN